MEQPNLSGSFLSKRYVFREIPSSLARARAPRPRIPDPDSTCRPDVLMSANSISPSLSSLQNSGAPSSDEAR